MPRRFAIAGAALLASGGAGASPNGEGQVPVDPHLVPLTQITVPIVDGGRMEGLLSMKLVLGAADADSAVALELAMPRLRSAGMAAASEFARLHASPHKAVDSEKLSQDLATALRREDPGVAMVLIVEVAARRA